MEFDCEGQAADILQVQEMRPNQERRIHKIRSMYKDFKMHSGLLNHIILGSMDKERVLGAFEDEV